MLNVCGFIFICMYVGSVYVCPSLIINNNHRMTFFFVFYYYLLFVVAANSFFIYFLFVWNSYNNLIKIYIIFIKIIHYFVYKIKKTENKNIIKNKKLYIYVMLYFMYILLLLFLFVCNMNSFNISQNSSVGLIIFLYFILFSF